MRTGIFGGTFNPFHNGHKKALNAFIKEFDLDRVFVIPTAIPPHKEIKKDISDDDRLRITRLSISDVKQAEICDWEIKNGGKSYTYLTLEHFRKEYPDDKLFLYVGTDMFLTLHEWRFPERIISEATIVAFPRKEGKGDLETIERQKKFLEEKYGAKCLIGKEKPVAVSSTTIREKIRQGESVSDYIDKKAEQYIKDKHLYILPSDETILNIITPRLSPFRLRHSLGVRDEIRCLAKIYGCDLRKAEVAALLHDSTKDFPPEWHLNYIKENNLEADDDFLKIPRLYHALTGSRFAEKEAGIKDPEILSAIKYHTTAKPNMTLLEKLLYVSDFTEPTRSYPDVDFYRKTAREDIDRTVALGLKWNIEELRKNNNPVYFLSIQAEKFYRKYSEKKGQKQIMNAEKPNKVKVAVTALSSKKAVDIKVLKVRDVTVLADYFVICSGTSNTHMRSLADECEYMLEQSGEKLLHREGKDSGSWLLLDFGDIIIHIYSKQAREFYNLERFWSDAEEIDIKEFIGDDE